MKATSKENSESTPKQRQVLPIKKQISVFKSFDNRKTLMSPQQNQQIVYNNCYTQQNNNNYQESDYYSKLNINLNMEKSIIKSEESSFNSNVKHRKFAGSQISKSDAQSILNLKLLLIKKGKVFGRMVLRWGQLTQNGKIVYFKSRQQAKNSGYYSLYQTTCFKTKQPYQSDIWKKFGLSQQINELDAIQLTLLSFSNTLIVLADPREQKNFESPMNEILNEMFKMSSNGELQQFLASLQICRSLVSQSMQFQSPGNNIKSFSNSSSSANSSTLEIQKKGEDKQQTSRLIANNNQSQFQYILNSQVMLYEQDMDSPIIDIPKTQKRIPHIMLVNSTKSQTLTYKTNQDKSNSKMIQQRMNHSQDRSISEHCDNNKDLSKSLLGPVNKMEKGAIRKSPIIDNRKSPLKDNWMGKNSLKEVKLDYLKDKAKKDQKKTSNNKGDMDDLSGNSDENDEMQNNKRNQNVYKGRVYDYDNDIQSNSMMMLMENNPIETFQSLNNSYNQEDILSKLGLNLNEMGGLRSEDNSYKQGERLYTVQNMDSNLNSLKGDFSQMDVGEQVRAIINDNNQNGVQQINGNNKIFPTSSSKTSTLYNGDDLGENVEEIIKQILEDHDCGEDNDLEQLKKIILNETAKHIHQKNNIEAKVINNISKLTEQELINMSVMEALYKGIEYSWNFDFARAKSIFKYFSQKGDLRHTLHKIEINMFQVLITGKKSQIDQCMLKVLKFENKLNAMKVQVQKQKSPIQIPHKTIKSNQKSSDYLIHEETNQDIYYEQFEMILTETLMFKGVLRFLSGNKFKAFLIFRECWKTYRKYEIVYQKIQDKEKGFNKLQYFDADFQSRLLLGLGLFYLGISALPRSLTPIVKIVGFSGNRDKGKQYLEKCGQEKRSRCAYASLILALFYIDQEHNLEQTCTMLKTYIVAFPHSSLFHWVSSIVSWKYAQLDDAVFFIERALNTCPLELSKEAAFLKYEVGWFHYLKMEYEQALFRFKEVLRDCLNIEVDDEDEEEKHYSIIEKDNTINEQESNKSINNFQSTVHDKMLKKFNNSLLQQEIPVSNYNSPSKEKLINEMGQDIAQRKEDFVYLPHRACLTIQIAGAYVALKKQNQAAHWLQTTVGLANQPGLTRSKLDQEMGHLATIYINHRKINDLLTFEITYFLHQMPKLPNSVLLQIITSINATLKSINISLNCQDPSIYKDSPYFPEYVSAMMMTIVAYCFLGDSDIACLFSERLVTAVGLLQPHFNYLAVHSLYWAARSYMAESNFKGAEILLNRAKKYKKYEFSIEGKLDKVLLDLKHQMNN